MTNGLGSTLDLPRRCASCGASIDLCNGFVLARDYLAIEAGAKIMPREVCGKCGIRFSCRVGLEGELLDTTEEEQKAFIAALAPPREIPT